MSGSWNGSWNGGAGNPRVLGAVVALSCGIGAEAKVIRADGSLDLSLGDVNFIRIDYQVRLQVGEVEIVIESLFKLRAEGTEYALDPGERGGLGPFLALWPDEVTMVSVGSDGTLHLTFGKGAALTVPPDPHCEAWQIAGPGTALIVCMTGTEGQLAVWT